MSQELNLSLANELLNEGKKLFELEKYAVARERLDCSLALVSPDSALGGEVQIWLANTYDVMGETAEAIAICQKLATHKDEAIAKQADFLINIFSAPELALLQDVTVTLPNLSNLDSSKSSKSFVSVNTNLDRESSNLSTSYDPDAIAAQKSIDPNDLRLWILSCFAILIVGCAVVIWLHRFT